MGFNKYLINDPAFCEYVFACMKNSGNEERAQLSPLELKHFRNDGAIKLFAENATLEKRLLMLARLGISYNIVLGPDKIDMAGALKSVPGQYTVGAKKNAITEQFARDKVFIFGSRDLLVVSHMAAQNSHSYLYTLDRKYITLHERSKSMLGQALIHDIKDAIGGFDFFSQVLMDCLANSEDNEIMSICGVDHMQMRVLLALYVNRSTMLSIPAICLKIGRPPQSANKLSHVVTKLQEMGYIEQLPGTQKKLSGGRSYMIMEKGIDAVMNYVKYIVKKSI